MVKKDKPENWKFYTSVIDGEELSMQGLNIWEHRWTDTRQVVEVKDPIYAESHILNIYEIVSGGTSVKFAAGEFSNLVWGIYLPV